MPVKTHPAGGRGSTRPPALHTEKGAILLKKFLERTEKELDTWAVKLAGINLSYPVDLVCGILFLLIGIALLLAMPQQVKISEKDVVNGRAFPTMLVWVMLAMSAILVGREGLNVLRHQPMRMKQLNLLTEAKALIIVLILFVTYLLAKTTGLFVLGGVFCALAFLVYFRCKRKSYYAITLAAAVIIWAVFRFVLGVNF